MPFFGRESKQKLLIEHLDAEFRKTQRLHHLPPGDFPSLARFQERLKDYDISKFPKLNQQMIEAMELVLGQELPKLMQQFPDEGCTQSSTAPTLTMSQEQQRDYTAIFWGMSPTDGKVSGEQAKAVLSQSELPFDILANVWRLSDIDRDGSLDLEEFCIAMFLCDYAKSNGQLPDKLPLSLVPERKRLLVISS